MRNIFVMLLVCLTLATTSCSRSKGKTSPGDLDDGNIPRAQAGSELSDVNFAFDSSTLSSQAQEILKTNAAWLQNNSASPVTVEGHCDERGTAEYNLALGQRRADSVKQFLKTLGVEDKKISTVSYGEELPLETGHTEGAWSKNRRGHFSIKN